MGGCDAFIAFGTKDYAQSTGNPAATDQELAYFQSALMKRGKALIPLRMISWDEEFDEIPARVLFNTNKLTLTWILGDPMPDDLVADIVRVLPQPSADRDS